MLACALWLCGSAAQEPQQDERPAAWLLLERIADARGLRAEFDQVPAHLAGMVEGYRLDSRLALVERCLEQPWHVPVEAAALRDGLAAAVAARGAELEPLMASIAGWLDQPDANALPELARLDELWAEIERPELVEQDLLERLSAFCAAADGALQAVTAALDDLERALFFEAFPGWCEAWYRQHFPQGELEPEQRELFGAFKRLSVEIDRARLLAVARRVARLSRPEFLAQLPRRLARTPRTRERVDGFSGDVLAQAGASPAARVVLLGTGKTTVSGAAALVIDLGGDDTWQRAAVADGPGQRLSVVLELGGDERYESELPGPAYSTGGAALLVDARGRDSYRSARLGQGATACGFAALVDLEGDDSYQAGDYAQGYSFCGVGLLLDRAGNDVFQAAAVAQGAGNGNGFAALVDGQGDDRYVANRSWPDVYGDSGPDSYHGASQGYSTGFRTDRKTGGFELAGGIAALVDLEGEDYYESGNFSQGGGYFFAFGLLYDGGGDDENHGYRYSQGFGVHQAAGMRWDAGGNDSYETRCAANCGAAWDEGVGWLLEEAGDDRYEVGGLALGGTANTAVAVLLDLAGDDHYGGGGGLDSQGGSGDSSYHGKQAIGALIDLGGGKDVYTRPERGDERILTGDYYGIFVDAREKTLEKLLEPKALEKLLQARGARR
jgi:hypothetical protein